MRRMIAAIGLLLTMTGSASAVIEQFFAPMGLTGSQEAPTPVVSPGTGTGTATYDSVANTLAVNVMFSGLTSNTTNAHIHCCTSTTLATGIAIHFVPNGFPLGVTSGNFSNTYNLGLNGTYDAGFLTASGGTANAARDRLLDAMRRTMGNSNVAYFNIHTANFPPGELRGNIALVPEPATVFLALCGLAAAFMRRSRR